jgi:hypothetical protein
MERSLATRAGGSASRRESQSSQRCRSRSLMERACGGWPCDVPAATSRRNQPARRTARALEEKWSADCSALTEQTRPAATPASPIGDVEAGSAESLAHFFRHGRDRMGDRKTMFVPNAQPKSGASQRCRTNHSVGSRVELLRRGRSILAGAFRSVSCDKVPARALMAPTYGTRDRPPEACGASMQRSRYDRRTSANLAFPAYPQLQTSCYSLLAR